MITLYNGNQEIVLPVTDDSYSYNAVMGENSMTLYFSSEKYIEIPIGSYCDFGGERYSLKKDSNFTKQGTRNFEYTLLLETDQADLKLWKIRNPVDNRIKFSYTATPREHLELFVANANRRSSGWSVGACIDGKEVTFEYNHTYIFDGLNDFASQLGTEWQIKNKTIHLRKVEYNKENPLILSYGKGNGFKTGVARETGNAPVEILLVQGTDKNIDFSKYGAKELLLPKSQTLDYEGRTYITSADGLSVMNANRPLTTAHEDSLDCSEIYPSREGTVGSVIVVDAEKNFYDFIDSSIPDDLNFEDYLIEGENMTIIFQTGMLASREFEVKYYHEPKTIAGKEKAGKRFEIVPQELDGITMPDGSTFTPQPGDTYAVFGIQLPDAYICDNPTKTGASWDMFREAAKYLYEHEDKQFTFNGTLDGIWAKKRWSQIGGKIVLGGYVNFSDKQFHPQGSLIRMVGIKRYVNKPYMPEIELSNTTSGGSISSDLNKPGQNEVVIDDKYKDSLRFTKRRFRDAKETMQMLEDALLNFSGAINPIAIQTMQLLVGDESLQFRFVMSKANPVQVSHNITYDETTRVLHVPGGLIQHMTLDIKILSSSHKTNEYKFWQMEEYNSASLVDEGAKYYLYAKVSKTEEKGTFLLSETAIKMEQISGYYHLLVGILNSEYDGSRSFVELYGFTEILPGRITTERIVSPSGTTYFDLIKEEIGGKIKFAAGSSGLENLDEWAEVSKDISAANDSANKANKAVENLNDYVDGAFADGIITEAEAKAIEKYINVVNSAKADVEATYTKLYSNVYLIGTPKTNLLNAKVTFMGAVDDLLKAINDAISDQKTTEAEKKNVDAKYAAFNTAYSSMSQAIEAANKAIQDTLKGYSDEALQAAKDAAKAAADAANSAGEANKAIGDLGDYVDGAFSDGIIEESEAKAIEKYINTVNATKSAVEATYAKLYANAYLSGTPKTNLLNAKVTLFGAISNLITSINTAIKDGKTTVEEKKDVDSKFATFNSAYASFNTAVEAANKAIQDTLKGYFDEAKDYTDEISLTLKDNVAKNLGYTNYAALEKDATAGKTIINGGKINTVLIEAAALVTSQLLADVINGNGLKIGEDKFVVTIDENKKASVSIKGHVEAESGTFKGRIEANEGVFYGSVAVPPQEIANNKDDLTLSFKNGFNFAGLLSNGVKKIFLPTTVEYSGVECSIVNYGAATNGYYEIKTVPVNTFLYSGTPKNRNTINSIKLYGTSQLKLKAIKVSGSIRWFIENYTEFSFDYINSCLTNGIPSQMARCLGSYWMASQSSLVVKACNDGNAVKFSSYNADGHFSFAFTKSRASNRDYTIIVRNESGNNCPYRISNKTSSGFTIDFNFQYVMGIEGVATVYVDSGNWGFDIFEFDT
jgi:hypothetical protein